MATISNERRRQKVRQYTTSKDLASFFGSQIVLFNSRRKHGILYSFATVAGIFCLPGILSAILDSDIVGTQLLIQRIVPLPFITLMIAAGMYILNDLVDSEIDRANSKNRPIPSGLVSKRQAKSFVILTNGAAAGMLLIFCFTPLSSILLVSMIIIGILYSMPKRIALMNRFILKNVAIAVFYMLCVMLGFSSTYGTEMAINSPVVAIHAMAVSGIMIFVGSTVNDLGDIKGDKAAGRRTIPVVLGGEKAVKLLIILLGSMPIISWTLYAVFVHHNSMNMMIPAAITIVALLAIHRMTHISKVFSDMKLMRDQHKKWFPLYIVLQSGIVVGGLLMSFL